MAGPTNMTPADIGRLPAGERAELAQAFAEAITGVFRVAVPVLVVGFLLTLLVREVPLRTASGQARRDGASTRSGALESADMVPVDAALTAAALAAIDAGRGLTSPDGAPIDYNRAGSGAERVSVGHTSTGR
ncbi:MAG TPA: hypothetical protein VK306_10915 [Acidimicrobiales bacterium]|nr:hypothetical protein [Acidimicrobiales bacterium]